MAIINNGLLLEGLDTSLIEESYELCNARFDIAHESVLYTKQWLEAYENANGNTEAMDSELRIITEGVVGNIWTKICEYFKKAVKWLKDVFDTISDKLAEFKAKILKKYSNVKLEDLEYTLEVEDIEVYYKYIKHCTEAAEAIEPVLSRMIHNMNEEMSKHISSISRYLNIELSDKADGCFNISIIDKDYKIPNDVPTVKIKLSHKILDKYDDEYKKLNTASSKIMNKLSVTSDLGVRTLKADTAGNLIWKHNTAALGLAAMNIAAASHENFLSLIALHMGYLRALAGAMAGGPPK